MSEHVEVAIDYPNGTSLSAHGRPEPFPAVLSEGKTRYPRTMLACLMMRILQAASAHLGHTEIASAVCCDDAPRYCFPQVSKSLEQT